MVNLVKILVSLAIALVSLVSCSNQPSLQKYFLEHETKENFTVVDIHKSILGIDESGFDETQKKAYESINKVQLLAYPIKNGNEETYKVEKDIIKQLFSTDEYTTIARMGTGGGKVIITYLGDSEAIDEMVVFGYGKEMGLGVARILGDDMSADEIFTLYESLNNSSPDDSQIKEYFKLFQ